LRNIKKGEEDKMNWKRWLSQKCEECANRWYNLALYNIYGHYYLWYLPGEKGGGLAVGEEKPGDDWELGDPQRISPMWTKEYVHRWIYEKARELPCLPLD